MENLFGSIGTSVVVELSFIWAGYTKLFVFCAAGTAAFFAKAGVPLPEVALDHDPVELVGGILPLIGFQARWVALALAIWCLITGFAYHLPAHRDARHDPLYKNLVMAGGLLYVTAFGAGRKSVDQATGWKMHKPALLILALFPVPRGNGAEPSALLTFCRPASTIRMAAIGLGRRSGARASMLAMADDEAKAEDHRVLQRTRVLRNAKIIVPRRSPVISLHRAEHQQRRRLPEVANTYGVPETFDLTFEHGRTRRSCRVVWRTTDKLGVTFESGSAGRGQAKAADGMPF